MSKIAKNTFIYTIGAIFPKVAGILLLPIYTTYMTPAEYGIVGAVRVLLPILTVLFSLSFDAAIFRLYWDYKTEEERTTLFSTIFFATIGLSGLMLLALFISQHQIQKIYTSIAFHPYFAYMILTVFIQNLFHLPQKYLMLKERAVSYVVLSVLLFVANTGLIMWFVMATGEGAAGYLKGGLLASLVLLPAYLYITLKTIRLRFSFPMLRNLLMFSLPLIPTALSAWVMNFSDRIFIERYFSLDDVGIYSLAYTIAGIVLILSTAANNAYRPVFFKLSNMEDSEKGKRIISRYTTTFVLIFAMICFCVSFFSKEIILMMFKPAYKEAFKVIPLISLAYFFSMSAGIGLGRYFEQSKKMKANMWRAVCIAILNIILNFLLIPPLGIYGAACATAISLGVGFASSYLYTRSFCYFVPYQWSIIVPVVLTFIVLVVLFEYVLHISSPVLSLTLKAGVCSLIILIIGLIRPDLVRSIYSLMVRRPLNNHEGSF